MCVGSGFDDGWGGFEPSFTVSCETSVVVCAFRVSEDIISVLCEFGVSEDIGVNVCIQGF